MSILGRVVQVAQITAGKAKDVVGCGDIVRSEKDYIAALTDIQEGRASARGNVRKMREKIDGYIRSGIQAKKGSNKEMVHLGGGAYATRFKQVIRVMTDEAPTTEEINYRGDDELVQALASHALALATNKDRAINCNVFTMDDMLNDDDPSAGDPNQLTLPKMGKDSHGNELLLLPGNHPEMYRLVEELSKSHEKAVDLGNDPYAWQRAAWLSILLQHNRKTLNHAFNSTSVNGELAERLASLAERLNGGNIQDTIHTSDDAQQKKVFLKYPDDDTENLEKDIKEATIALLGAATDRFGKPLLENGERCNASHVFSLMNALNVRAALHGSGTDVPNKLVNLLSVSRHGLIKETTAKMGEGKSEASLMTEACAGVPLLQRMGGGRYGFRMPKPGKAEAEDTRQGGSRNDAKQPSERSSVRPGNMEDLGLGKTEAAQTTGQEMPAASRVDGASTDSAAAADAAAAAAAAVAGANRAGPANVDTNPPHSPNDPAIAPLTATTHHLLNQMWKAGTRS